MTDLEKAIAAAREALNSAAPTAALDAVRLDGALRNLLAALDAARGEAVYVVRGPWLFKHGDYFASANDHADAELIATALNAAPPAADTQRAIIEAAERRGYERGLKEAPPAAAVIAANVTPMRQPRADLARLVESINAAVYANGDGLSVTEAIGALELAKLELFKEQEK